MNCTEWGPIAGFNDEPFCALTTRIFMMSIKYVKQTLYRISIWISNQRRSLILFVSAPFFVDCISEQDLDEMNIEIIRNTLYKAYLEAFFNFCKELGGTTADVMCEILAVSNEWNDNISALCRWFSQADIHTHSSWIWNSYVYCGHCKCDLWNMKVLCILWCSCQM